MAGNFSDEKRGQDRPGMDSATKTAEALAGVVDESADVRQDFRHNTGTTGERERHERRAT